jgi:hypothetical protein
MLVKKHPTEKSNDGVGGLGEALKEKTPGVALSKAYKKDFDGKKPGQDRPETALTGAYSKTGKPGGALKKSGVAENINYWHKLQAERNTRINSLITELKESIK